MHQGYCKPNPEEVLAWLEQGNLRFCQGQPQRPHCDAPRLQLARRGDQAEHALATVLACSDSRVPVEILFDAGIMDLFVVRVAGNTINDQQAASLEYGLVHVATPLLLVLGHTHCGAVTAALKHEKQGQGRDQASLKPLLAPLLPVVQRVLTRHPQAGEEEQIARAVEENVWQALDDFLAWSPTAEQLISSGQVKAVGAVYQLDSGQVGWLPERTAALALG
jgi:carbonic anhydrase